MSSTLRILDALVDRGIEFVLVGMASAIAQGVPLNTFDLDIVHRRTAENVERLLGLLESIDAIYRTDARNLRPSREALLGPGHQLLPTRLGIVDCLGVMTLDGADGTYEDLLPHSITLHVDGRELRVLSLEAYIRVKREAARPKDLAVLPVLEATLRELEQRKS